MTRSIYVTCLFLGLLLAACAGPASDAPAPVSQPAAVQPTVDGASPPAEQGEEPAAAAPAPEVAKVEAAGPTAEQQWLLDTLKSQGPAPELTNEVWLNSQPLRLADLRGRVVLVEMWTFG